MIRRPPRSTLDRSSAASDVYKRQIYNGVVISKGIDGAFYAATVICSHENEKKVLYDKSKNQYICSAHGATFDLTGKGTNKNGSSGLTIYKTLLNGTILRVYY